MNNNADKHIEQLTDKLMKDTSLETPSLNFTADVMSQVQAIAQSNITTYKPLITKRVWAIIIAVIAGILIYSLFNNANGSNWLQSVNLNALTNNKFTNALSGINFSKTIVYAVVLFALMFTVQIPILKGYFNRRLGV